MNFRQKDPELNVTLRLDVVGSDRPSLAAASMYIRSFRHTPSMCVDGAYTGSFLVNSLVFSNTETQGHWRPFPAPNQLSLKLRDNNLMSGQKDTLSWEEEKTESTLNNMKDHFAVVVGDRHD